MKFKIIPGSFSTINFNSCEIGWQGLLASGNNNFVQITDPKTGQLIQTLEKHTLPVHIVRWTPCYFYHDLKKPYSLKLASADTGGNIIIWDATFSTILSDFSRANKKVLDMHWMRNQEVNIDFLLVLHSGNELVLWNTDSGNRVWDKIFSSDINPLFDFCVDPHDQTNILFRAEYYVLLMSGISLARPPEGNGIKYYNCPDENEITEDAKDQTLSRSVLNKSSQLIKTTTKLVKDLAGNEIFKVIPSLWSSSQASSYHCIQILYHGYCHNHIILVYPREILVVDLMIFQVVACIGLDKNVSNFVQVYSCWQNDILYCHHESGIVTIRGRRAILVNEDSSVSIYSSPEYKEQSSHAVPLVDATESWFELGHYQLLCQTESPRLLRNVRVVAMAVVVSAETLLALLSTDGKIQMWQMKAVSVPLEVIPAERSYLLAPDNLVRSPAGKLPTVHPLNYPMLGDLAAPMVDMAALSVHLEFPREAGDSQPWCIGSYRALNVSPSQQIGRIEYWNRLQINMVAFYQGLISDAVVVKANPVDFNDSANEKTRSLVIVGNNKGIIQLWNLPINRLERELQAMHSSIRGIEWIQPAEIKNAVLSGRIVVYGYNVAGSSGKAKNGLTVVHLDSGQVVDLRPDSNFESVIECVRVSHLRQYFAVLLKDGVVEVWDSTSLNILREIPTNSPLRPVTILEWSNIRSGMPNTVGYSINSDQNYVKEKFLTVDNSGMMQHVVIDGNAVIKGKQVPVETSLSKISAMAYRNSIVVLGDVDGNLLFWNFKASRTMPGLVNQGRINRISFDNLPASSNSSGISSSTGNSSSSSMSRVLAVLSNEGFSIWNWNEAILIKMIKWSRDNALSRVIHFDWLDAGHSLIVLNATMCSTSMTAATTTNSNAATSSLVAVMSNHNSVELAIVRSSSLEKTSSVVELTDFAEVVLCPSMLPPKLNLSLKMHLQHQPWLASSTAFTLDVREWWDTINSGFHLHKINGIIDRLRDMASFPANQSDNLALDLARRCQSTALLFGDEYEYRLWTLVIYQWFPSTTETVVMSTMPTTTTHLLPWEYSWPRSVYRAYQRSRLWSLERKRSTQKQTSKCAEAFIMLGELDRAVRLLLETPPGHASYVQDLQLACLLSSSGSNFSTDTGILATQQQQQHQSTVKLAATQLVANNCLKDGVQLLCSIRNHYDACRYLQTYGEWRTALWLAKCTLSDVEVNDITKQYIQHLAQSISKSFAVMDYIGIKDLNRCINLLLSMHQIQLAVRLIEFAELMNIEIQYDKEKTIKSFCEHLESIGCHDASEYYSKLIN